MEIYDTEEEQIAALKRWWKANGNSVISGLVAGILLIGGWSFWQSYQQDTRLQASALYEQMLRAINLDNTESANKIAERLNEQYSSTPYSVYAKMFQAKLKVQEGDLNAAKQLLQNLVASTDNGLKNVANIRLIRLLLATGEYEQGLQLISAVDQASAEEFAANYEELKGDLYVALDRQGEARTAYQNALRAGHSSPLLQYKIEDLTAPELADTNS